MNNDPLYQEALEKIARSHGISHDEVERRIKDVRDNLSKKTADCLTASEWQIWRVNMLSKNKQLHVTMCVFCEKVSKVQWR